MEIDGKALAQTIYNDLTERINVLKKQQITPHLVVILAGQDPASVAYVTLKQKKAEEVGAKVTILRYGEDITTEELLDKVRLLNEDPFVHGILIQRPLPKHVDEKTLELATNPEKDLDGFHPKSPYTLPLPLAIMRILHSIYNLKFETDAPNDSFIEWLRNEKIALIGKGPTGGGPIKKHFAELGIIPKVIDSKTKNADSILKESDIIISAVGKQNVVQPDHLKKDAIVLSVGINRGGEGNKLHGDYQEELIKELAGYYTPTPGGVGPVNVAMLIEQLVSATEKQIQM